MRTLTRAEMRRAAWALMCGGWYRSAANRFRVPFSEIDWNSPRNQWALRYLVIFRDCDEASMLMSESYRPANHDGDE
jgi:hypothetical protein